MTSKRICVWLFALFICCDSRVLLRRTANDGPITTSTRPMNTPVIETGTPVTDGVGPSCDFDMQQKCNNLSTATFSIMYAPAANIHDYSRNVCRAMKAEVDCRSQIKACLSPFDTVEIMYGAICEFEDRCRLVDSLNCMTGYDYNPMVLESHKKICPNVGTIDQCASRRMAALGCTPTNKAPLLWSFMRLILRQSCAYLSLQNTSCSLSDGIMNCLFSDTFNLMTSIGNKNLTTFCSSVQTIRQCFVNKLPDARCDEVSRYFNDSIAILNEMNEGCPTGLV